jgi:hypothetical protein
VFLLTIETNQFLNGFFLFLYLRTDIGPFKFISHINNHQEFLVGNSLVYFKHRIVTSCKATLKMGRTSHTLTRPRFVHGGILCDGQRTVQRKDV